MAETKLGEMMRRAVEEAVVTTVPSKTRCGKKEKKRFIAGMNDPEEERWEKFRDRTGATNITLT